MKEDLYSLSYPLPEDIEKLKWFGDFEECRRVIGIRLEESIPQVLRDRLLLELSQLRRMERCYTVSTEEALRILTENLVDFQPEELDQLRRENIIDWIYVKGQIWYINSFYENLIKVRLDIRARQKNPELPETEKKTAAQIRDEMIHLMKTHDSVTCRMKIRTGIHFSEELRRRKGTARVYLPLPLENFQSKKAELLSASCEMKLAAPVDYPQRTALFEGTAEEVADCSLEFEVTNVVKYVDPKPELVTDQQPGFYLHEELPHISFTPYMVSLTKEIIGKTENPLIKARKIYDFITTKVNYSFMRSYYALPVIPEYCASRLRGDCGVQALTFITMCRIAGVPARWQSGLHADPLGAGCHDWAMFYVAPYGWLWADCSFGGAAWREGAKERWDFYFGNLDPYRVVQASEFQHDFTPPMKFRRADPYDNQTGEVEFEDGPVDPWEYDSGPELLELEISAD